MIRAKLSINSGIHPICTGTGLVALDVVINGDSNLNPKLWAGGSCGNVITILSYLGWRTYPIIRIGDDRAAREILIDLKKFNVIMDFAENDRSVRTPIIVEKIFKRRNGSPTHKFLWACPNCGRWLPRYRSILHKKAYILSKEIPKADVFYFDRVSPGALELARNAKEQGTLVVFEPQSINNRDLFRKAVQLSQVIKYSFKQGDCLEDLFTKYPPNLVVETFGAEGLRYRFRGNKKKLPPRWKALPAFEVDKLRDAAGSGDWCTAGMLHLIGRNGAKGLKVLPESHIENALQFGQSLAALNCRFEGARGGMYSLNKQAFERAINDILTRGVISENISDKILKKESNLIRCYCPHCQIGT